MNTRMASLRRTLPGVSLTNCYNWNAQNGGYVWTASYCCACFCEPSKCPHFWITWNSVSTRRLILEMVSFRKMPTAHLTRLVPVPGVAPRVPVQIAQVARHSIHGNIVFIQYVWSSDCLNYRFDWIASHKELHLNGLSPVWICRWTLRQDKLPDWNSSYGM